MCLTFEIDIAITWIRTNEISECLNPSPYFSRHKVQLKSLIKMLDQEKFFSRKILYYSNTETPCGLAPLRRTLSSKPITRPYAHIPLDVYWLWKRSGAIKYSQPCRRTGTQIKFFPSVIYHNLPIIFQKEIWIAPCSLLCIEWFRNTMQRIHIAHIKIPLPNYINFKSHS